MALNAKTIKGAGGGDRVEQPVIEVGTYPARIVQIVDLGVQEQKPFQGKAKPPVNEIMITYELVDCFMVDKDGKELEDKPRWISETMALHNLKADKAKSTQRYTAADPNNLYDGDFSKLVDTPVNISLVHNKQGDKLYVNVSSIAAMRTRDVEKCPALKNPAVFFDLDAPDLEVFNSFPDWIQEKVKKNLNYNGSKLQAALEEGFVPAKKEEAEAAPVEGNDDKPWD